MKELFKGYIELKGKKAIEKFKDRTDFKNFNDVQDLDGYAGVLAPSVVLIDVDDKDQSEILMDIVEDLQLQCRVYETTRGKHFYFENNGSITKCGTHLKLAIGLEADIKFGDKNSYDALKVDGKARPIIFDKDDNADYDPLPFWLVPVKTDIEFLNMEEGDGRNDALFKYILTLQRAGLTKEEVKETITMINKYILKEPVSDDELKVIMRDEAFKDDDGENQGNFYNSQGTFLFDRFSNFLIEKYHIIKIDNQMFIYDDGIYKRGSDKIEGIMIKHIPRLNRQKRSEVLAYIDISIKENTQPSDARYIAFKNGIYDVKTGSLVPLDPKYVVTNKINWNYNENAYNELADKTLTAIANFNSDIRHLLEEVIGYCFYRRNELRKAFILTGLKSNGKSTYLSLIQKLLGDENTCSVDLAQLSDRFKTAELHMKLANIGDDIEDDFIPNPSVFKKAVSGDRLNAEFKGRDPFDFSPYAKQLYSANNIPRIKDKGAVIDRLIIVPFNNKFEKGKDGFDPFIKYKLLMMKQWNI